MTVSFLGRLSWTFKDHAHVMQPGDEAAPVNLLAAAGAVAEADYVGRVLVQAGGERKPFRVPGERNEARLAVGVVAHEHGQLAAALQGPGTVAEELAVAAQEVLQRRGTRQ